MEDDVIELPAAKHVKPSPHPPIATKHIPSISVTERLIDAFAPPKPVLQLSKFFNGRQLYDTQLQSVGEMLHFEKYPREIEVYKGEGTSVTDTMMRALWYRALLIAGVGYGKTCVVLEFLRHAAVINETEYYDTSLILVPNNLFTQWHNEVDMMEEEPSLVFKFIEKSRPIRHLVSNNRVYIVKESIADEFFNENTKLLFDRIVIDEADSINIPWRNMSHRVIAKQLWYVSASIGIEKVIKVKIDSNKAPNGNIFLGRRVARASCMPGHDRPIVMGIQKIIEWKVTRKNFEFCAIRSQEMKDLLTSVEISEVFYALGDVSAILKAKQRIEARYAREMKSIQKKLESEQGRDSFLVRPLYYRAKREEENCKLAMETVDNVVQMNTSEGEYRPIHLRDALIEVFDQIPRDMKILLVGCNPYQNIGSLQLNGRKTAHLRGTEAFMAKTLESFALPYASLGSVDVLMLDSRSSKITGMNLQHTGAIIFADDFLSGSSPLKSQAEGRALRTGRDPNFELLIFNAVNKMSY